MIGKLQGIVDTIGDGHIILMVGGLPPLLGGAVAGSRVPTKSEISLGGSAATGGGYPGVGYKVFTPNQFAIGEFATLWIETVVREDSIRLFGFATSAQQELFNQLTTVSGVGPKVAMAILGTLKPTVLMAAIATGDAKTIATAPGVGKKVAEKIIVELKGSVGANHDSPIYGDDSGANSHSPLPDLLAALETLGYRRADVAEMAQRLVKENPIADVGTLVRLALKEIAK